MTDHVSNIKRFAEKYADAAKDSESSGHLDQAARQRIRSRELLSAAEHIEALERQTKALPKTFGDLSDLPPELLEELNISKTDEVEDQIFAVINSYDGEADLDQILIGLFRNHGVVMKRRFVQNKLYKMIKSEIIWNVEGRKGVYATTEPILDLEATAEDLAAQFEDDEDQFSEIQDDPDQEIPF
jgi:hypothetical protein